MALLRHIDAEDEPDEMPSSVWSTRAALHATDACMALLALELAELKERPATVLARYAEAHMERTSLPLVVVLGDAMRRNLQPRRLARMLRPMATLWRYYRSGRAALDPYPERETRINDFLLAILAALDIDSERSVSDEVIAKGYAAELAKSAETSDRENG